MAGIPLSDFLVEALKFTPNPDLALTNLERWANSASSPPTQLQMLAQHRLLGRYMLVILGASQPISNTLIQNPELAGLAFDSALLHDRPEVARVVAEGRTLLASASSPSHALDRLRYLKQRWTLPTVLNDISGDWSPAAVWDALSQVADALIHLTADCVAKSSELVENPLLLVAFGKLGGRELNYSSDVDLAFVAPDGLGANQTKLASKYAESVIRALSEPMGRGFLYRVDLRLRPYGAAGELVPSAKSVENYYKLYAEPWEKQALIRSRPVCGPAELANRWQSLVAERAYPKAVSEASLESLSQMRSRVEERTLPDDFKRGAGGIRDVEFLVQFLQLSHGHYIPELQGSTTLEAIAALEEAGFFDHSVATSLAEAYTFLRQLEHRCQLVGDQQVHTLPRTQTELEGLALLLGEDGWRAASDKLKFHRRTIDTLYQAVVQPKVSEDTSRRRVLDKLGWLAPAALHWFDPIPGGGGFYDALDANEGSSNRVHLILEQAPAIVGAFRQSISLTEVLMSGEIEEDSGAEQRIASLPTDLPLPELATAFSVAYHRLVARWVLEPGTQIHKGLTFLTDAFLSHCARRHYASFDLIALGSYGRGEMGLGSDADVLLIVDSQDRHAEAEEQAQGFLAMIQGVKRLGAPIHLDMRLRPEGRQGLLVRTYDGFRAYELDRMEMWERFALCGSRLVFGSPDARDLAIHTAYAQPLTPERLRELLAMKRRIETERIQPQHLRRNVKLGVGGLGDIEWFVNLHQMRYPTATKPEANADLASGIRALGRARLINALESETLRSALTHLLTVRFRLGLQGFAGDLIPENPDKLRRLASAMGDAGANEFLRRHEAIIDSVRSIFNDGMERLRA